MTKKKENKIHTIRGRVVKRYKKEISAMFYIVNALVETEDDQVMVDTNSAANKYYGWADTLAALSPDEVVEIDYRHHIKEGENEKGPYCFVKNSIVGIRQMTEEHKDGDPLIDKDTEEFYQKIKEDAAANKPEIADVGDEDDGLPF